MDIAHTALEASLLWPNDPNDLTHRTNHWCDTE
jgi:hypothetical protein